LFIYDESNSFTELWFGVGAAVAETFIKVFTWFMAATLG
jgi:hypothetical protein